MALVSIEKMLFIVNHKHTAETCPAGKIHHDDNFMQNLDSQIKKAGLKVVEGYLDAPGHQFYFVVDADSPGQIFESFASTLNPSEKRE